MPPVNIPGMVEPVNFPDTMSNDEIALAIKTKVIPQFEAQRKANQVNLEPLKELLPSGGQTQPGETPPQEKRSLLESGAAIAGGVARGVSDVVGVPVDILAGGMRAVGLPIPDAPVGGTEFFKKTLQPVQPKEPLERILAETGRFVGSAATGAGLVGKGAQVLKGTTPLRRVGETTTSRILKDIAELGPAELAKREIAPGIGAGVATGITKEFTDSPTAQLIAGVVGGVVPSPTAWAARKGIGVLARLKNIIKPSATATKEMLQETKVVAGSQLNEALGGTTGIKTESELDLLRKYGGTEPTLAQAAKGETGMGLMKKRIEQSPEAARKLIKVQTIQQRFINKRFKQLAPDGDANSVRIAVGRNIVKAEKAMEVATNIGENISIADAGGGTRYALIRLENESANGWRTLYAQADSALGGSPEINTIKTKIAANQALERLNLIVGKTAMEADIPDAIRLVIGKRTGKGKMVGGWKKKEDLSTLIGIERKINAELRASQSGVNPNAIKEKVLLDFKSSLRNLIDSETEKLITTAKTGYQRSAAEIYRQARELRAEHARVYGQGLVADILKKNTRGDFSQTESSIIKKILSNEESAAEFKAATGQDPKGELLIEYGVAQELKNAPLSNVNGEISAKNLEKWLIKKRDVLKYFPNVKKRVQNILGAQKVLDETYLVRSVVDGDPETAIRDIFSSSNKVVAKRRLGNLLDAVEGDAEAKRGLANAFWKEANFRGKAGEVTFNGEPMLQTDKISKLINDENYKWFFEKMYTPEQIKNWREFLKVSKTITDRMVKTGQIALEESELKNKALLTVETMAGRGWAVARKVVGIPYTVTTLGIQALSKVLTRFQRRELRALMNEAVFNAELAGDLILSYKKPELAFKKLNAWMLLLGIRTQTEKKETPPTQTTNQAPQGAITQ